MHQWGVGQKGKDNGAVLFLFTGDRKMRIEVGYGLEGVLTDAKSKQITSTIIKPRLKANDYNGAVEQGADAMLAVVRGEGLKGTGQTTHEAKRVRLGSGFVQFIPLRVHPVDRSHHRDRKGGAGGGPRSSGWTSMTDSDSSSWSSSSSSSSSDSFSDSSSSSSDSSFDGGGGDSGGGGASDSW